MGENHKSPKDEPNKMRINGKQIVATKLKWKKEEKVKMDGEKGRVKEEKQ